MNVFETHAQIVNDYATYIRSFLTITDPQILQVVETELAQGKLWPEPLLQFNPSFEMVGPIHNLPQSDLLHPGMSHIFPGYTLYRHQIEAMQLGTAGQDFIVTSGTGSGKSLTYIGSIFHHLLTHPQSQGVTAVIVYPMNALINSQTDEFGRYKNNYEQATGRPFPITFGQYTGQEKEHERAKMRENPPQILLTNYMMLELLLTRQRERAIRDGIYANLRFLVFDELHTFRGRQGADVAMLIRRIRGRSAHPIVCIGTSATMVSGGSLGEQKEEVARVAAKLFGKPFTAAQVINETLDRSLTFNGRLPTSAELAEAIRVGVNPQAGVEALRAHPVAVWLENQVALAERDGELVRGQPRQVREIVQALAETAVLPFDQCQQFLQELLEWISAVNQELQASGQRYTILPFKLHQFISQTGSVYTTLDQDENRFITLEPGVYKQDDAAKKPIFPNVFSRASGHPFICVTRVGGRLEPREFRDSSGEEMEESDDGYLIIGDAVWNPDEDSEFLPESWLRVTKAGLVPRTEKKAYFPIKLYFDEFGNCSETTPLRWWGWFMKASLLFDPTSGVFYDTKTNEGTKLTRLGSEGRSTSTTITAFAILNQLDRAGYRQEDQKLLSFTDNRQDAALQAGHFNDFIQVAQLRAGIYKAIAQSPVGALTYASIGEAIFNALNLPFLDFANRNEETVLPHVRRNYEQCFQNYLLYRAIHDLRRSWRIVLPNLEQCALLKIQYADLPEVAALDDYWQEMPLLNELDCAERETFLTTILDFFRLEYAIHSENYLTGAKLKEYEKQFREMLRPPWTLDKQENLREPFVIRYEPLSRTAKLSSKSLGPASALGKYIKLYARQRGSDVNLKGENYRDFILKLMALLEGADYLKSQKARAEKNEEISVYRLRLDRIIWALGDGETFKPDSIKQRSYKGLTAEPNRFFQALYRRDFAQMKRLRGEDHTGQLQNDTRQEREGLFREGKISALFCSPTMELGIDIRNLSVVHMRNAPPNPANYAQRSGRAGRSGQAALVFTYCSSYSPHDRHYFKEQAALVAGAVQAPRLDLLNRELLLSHLNALVASEIGLPGLDGVEGVRPSILRLVVNDNDAMPLDPGVRAGLELSPSQFNQIKGLFKRVIADFEAELLAGAEQWYSAQWVEQNLGAIDVHLDSALNRWRKLYLSARTILTRATQQIESGVYSLTSDEYRKHKRNQDQATRQLDLLRNDSRGSIELSEFYPYRYLASEGFLPGYNFTRLPLRVFLPTGETSGEFVSRPRAIALREFGPQNIIYHNGRKYRVNQLVVQDTESNLTSAKVSSKAGYFLSGAQESLEICPFSGLNLGDNANKFHLINLLEMSESRAEEIERISCEEEERLSRGYNIQTYFTIDGGDLVRVQKAMAYTSENRLLNLRYIPAARLVHVNSKWRSQKEEGFPIGLVSGDWRSSLPGPESQAKESFQLVKLWTSNLADALYLEPIQPLGLEPAGVITLQYALKRAIELCFQVESNEIGVIAIGDPAAPNILLYEAAEGSLGILSRFTAEPDIFHEVIQRATALCRYDDPDYKAPASYDDLLSYYNQRDHRIIDRFLIQDALAKLRLCDVEIQTNAAFRDYEEHYQSLLRHIDPNSSTERRFLDYLYQQGLRLPDAAQKEVAGIYVKPDFYYEPRIWVFCDGTPHDAPAVQAEDELKRQAIMAQGDEVWVYYYKDNLAEIIAARPDIFRKVR
jgi:superfamily II DNA or RNA helicase